MSGVKGKSGIYIRTAKIRKSLSNARKQNPTRYWLGKKRPQAAEIIRKINKEHSGNKHYAWKGEDAGYGSKHDWVNKSFGKPKVCNHCGTTKAKKYEWANISGLYKRIRLDWLRLCKSCHMKFDNVPAKIWEARRRVYV